MTIAHRIMLIWRVLTNHWHVQWMRLEDAYPGRRVRVVLRQRKGQWRVQGFRVDPPSEFERQLEAVIRRVGR